MIQNWAWAGSPARFSPHANLYLLMDNALGVSFLDPPKSPLCRPASGCQQAWNLRCGSNINDVVSIRPAPDRRRQVEFQPAAD